MNIIISLVIIDIIFSITIYFLGYFLGQQKILKDLLQEDLKRVKDYEYTRITKTNNR